MSTPNDTVLIPDHKIIGVLGQGGMARVFLARDEAFDRLVAVKVIDAGFAADVQFQRRFEREAKTAGGLSHPNIVPVHRYGTTVDGRPYLTMAYLEGGSLRDRMRKRGAMTVDEALGIARQIASALLAAHTRSIVHRDLKPDNVLFQGETAYLTDFGIAKLLNAATELTGTGLNPGTVRYFSPEQAQEHAVDARSDIYALGILLYEMLMGRQPIEADTIVQMLLRIVNMPPKPLPEQLRGLQPFMDILLAKDPADRLGSCQEVVSIIDAMLRNLTRYGDLDRLADGVVMTPSRRATPAIDLDADTQLGPARAAANEARAGAEVPATGSQGGAADGASIGAAISGAPGGARGRSTAAASGAESASASGWSQPAEANELTVARRSEPADMDAVTEVRASRAPDSAEGAIDAGTGGAGAGEAATGKAVTGEDAQGEDPAPDATAAARAAPTAAPARSAAPAPTRSRRPLAALAAAIALAALAGWYGTRERGPEVGAASEPASQAAPVVATAPAQPNLMAPDDDATTSIAVTAAPASATQIATPVPTGASAPSAAGNTASPAPAAQAATLNLRVTPADASITLPELAQRYRPGLALPAGDVLVRIERRGFAPREERLRLRPGANDIERVLTLAGTPAASPSGLAGGQAAPGSSPAASPLARTGTEAQPSAPDAAPARRLPGPIRRPGERFHDTLANGESGPEMVVIPAGSFRMGGTGRDEGPPRNVNLQRAFAAGVYEVTFDEYDRYTRAEGLAPAADQGWGRGRRPVINVSWNDAKAYTAWLSARTGQRYRLLSEAEWEYAHRAGTSSTYTFGDTLLPGKANCDGCGSASRQSTDVGSYAPNRFGLYDTHGNVWEWVEDCYGASYAGAPSDGRARSSNGCRDRVFRGGSWFFDALSMRSSKRSVFAAGNRSRDLGFRVARDL